MQAFHTTIHKDGTVTYWSVYQQQWVRRVLRVPDQELAAMSADERARVVRAIPYLRAEDRISSTPELEEHRETILYGWEEGDEHYEWAATCDLAELISWAETVESGG